MQILGLSAATIAAHAVLLLMPHTATAQQRPPIGIVPTRDALIKGQVQVSGEQAALISNVSVTVYDHPAPVALGRGGQLLACSTSEFHLLRSGPGEALVFGLDRGALELRSGTRTGDMLITPDLRLTPATPGAYDLRLRVTREGDTCVENDGPRAPVLNVTDAFSTDSYKILPGQHMLFVKGDLHRVVDHERSPCGCPANTVEPHEPGKPLTAAEAHPFPEAQSVGLAPVQQPANAAPAGVASSQVTTTFSYGEGATPPRDLAPAAGTQGASGSTGIPGATGTTASGGTRAQQPAGGFFHSIGHFFHKLFHPGP
jgi:hypothetical protein